MFVSALIGMICPAEAKAIEQATAPIVGLPVPPPSFELSPPTLSEESFGNPAENPPLPAASSSSVDGVPSENGELRYAVPRSNITLTPKLRFNGGIESNPNDVRAAPPQPVAVNRTPGLAATVDLGDVTLGTQLNHPLRSADPRFAPDGRPASSAPDFHLDLKLKF